nr:ribonuclease H domain-containing protein [Tanacetum cinerariifolium]
MSVNDVIIISDHEFAFNLQIQEAMAATKRRKTVKSENIFSDRIIDLTNDEVDADVSKKSDQVFRVYVKGIVSDEKVMNVRMRFGGIGVVICDAREKHVFEVKKGFLVEAANGGEGERDGEMVEVMALVEGLSRAVKMGLRRVSVCSDSDLVYNCLTGKGKPTNKKIVTLVDQVNLIQTKFTSCDRLRVSQKNVKCAYKLARNAIASEASKWEEKDSGCTFIEQSMLLQGKLPQCPHEKCKSKLGIGSCKKFLNPEVFDLMSLRIKESSIPPAERVYCPFANCSALMSKTEVQANTITSTSTGVKGTERKECVKCHRGFCINCKVAWHHNITCSDYKKSFLYKSSNEGKLQSLATKNRWRECIKCKTFVELAKGCYHMTCRCGYEFCYTCGAEWIKKKPTCRCVLWDERNLLYAQQNRR